MIIQLHKGTGLIGNLIKWQTRGVYSHASIIIDEDLIFEAREFKGVGFNWRYEFKNIDYYYISLSLSQQFKAVEFIDKVNGSEYDYKMVARFMTRMSESNKTKDKYFCSELVFDLLHYCGIDLFKNTQGWEVSPHLLSRSPILEKINEKDVKNYRNRWNNIAYGKLLDLSERIAKIT